MDYMNTYTRDGEYNYNVFKFKNLTSFLGVSAPCTVFHY